MFPKEETTSYEYFLIQDVQSQISRSGSTCCEITGSGWSGLLGQFQPDFTLRSLYVFRLDL